MKLWKVSVFSSVKWAAIFKGLFAISQNSLNRFTPSLDDPVINIKSLTNSSLSHFEMALMKNLTTNSIRWMRSLTSITGIPQMSKSSSFIISFYLTHFWKRKTLDNFNYWSKKNFQILYHFIMRNQWIKSIAECYNLLFYFLLKTCINLKQ